jgi:acyl dehydratase
MLSRALTSIDDLLAVFREEPRNFGDLGTPDLVSQLRINGYADWSGDHQWIHTDPERAYHESPFGRTAESSHGKTIAHAGAVLGLRDTLMPLQEFLAIPEVHFATHRYGEYKFLGNVVADNSIRARMRPGKLRGPRDKKYWLDFDYEVCVVELGDEVILSGSSTVVLFLR